MITLSNVLFLIKAHVRGHVRRLKSGKVVQVKDHEDSRVAAEKKPSGIKKGDPVRIKPEYQDPGDDEFEWVATEDEDGGRVRISPSNIGLNIRPNTVVTVDMLEPVRSGSRGSRKIRKSLVLFF